MMNGVEVKNEDGTTRIEGGKGCIGCGNRDLVIREVDTSKMPKKDENINKYLRAKGRYVEESIRNGQTIQFGHENFFVA